MQKIFIVTLAFRKRGETPVVNTQLISEEIEAAALDEALKLDTSLRLVKEGYLVESSDVQALNYGVCPQNSPHHYGYLTSYKTQGDIGIGIYINLQIPQTPELLADLTALMKKHYQVTLSL